MSTIVIGYDGSKGASEALQIGVAEAERRGDDVLVIQSWTEPTFGVAPKGVGWFDPSEIAEAVGSELRQTVAELSEEHRGVAFALDLVAGRADREILDAADRTDASLIVVGSRGRGGFAGLLLGSVSHDVVAYARVPVIVARSIPVEASDVLVGFDGTPEGRRALSWAAAEARSRGVPLHGLMAWGHHEPQGLQGPEQGPIAGYSTEQAVDIGQRIASEVLGPTADLEVRVEAPCDLPARALVDRSDRASLLVICPREESRHHHLRPSSASLQVLHHAACPVAIVPPPTEQGAER